MMKFHFLNVFLACLLVVLSVFIFLAISSEIENYKNKIDIGVVVEKQYHPTRLQPIVSGKITTLITIPEYFNVLITDGSKKYYTDIPEGLFLKIKVGDTIDVSNFKLIKKR